jgi:hypothetical protein
MVMKNKIFVLILTLILSGLAIDSHAQAKGREDRRQRKQSRQIERGVKKGTITSEEEKALKADQKKIQKMERHSERNGQITVREGRRMERKQDQAARKIRQARKK